MAFIDSIGAGLFSDLSVSTSTAPLTGTDTKAEFDAMFQTEASTPAAGTFMRIKNVREYPAMGTPPNVVNVPVFGQSSSQQIQAQSDAPNMEITMNFVASEWDSAAGKLGAMVGNGRQYAFRFTLLNSEPTGTDETTKYASSVTGIGTVQNAYYYWIGKMDALMITPSLSDSNQATLTITIQSKFHGAFTV